VFEHLKGKRVLLTGHTGFKGAWMAAWLHKIGAKVRAISLPAESKEDLSLKLNLSGMLDEHLVDIRDGTTVIPLIRDFDPEVVIHMAAQALVLRSYNDPVTTHATNYLGTLNVLEGCRKAKSLKGIVCITTDKVYENHESDQGYAEHERLGGHDPYSASKAASEILIKSHWQSFFKDQGVAVYPVRAGNVIGGCDWCTNRIVPDFFRAYFKNEPLILRNPDAVRPWQHVLEPVHAYLHIAEGMVTGKLKGYEPFNIGPERSSFVSVGELIELFGQAIAKRSGRKPEVRIERSPIVETKVLWLNREKIERQMGWKPVVNIKQSAEIIADCYLDVAKAKTEKEVREIITKNIETYGSMRATHG